MSGAGGFGSGGGGGGGAGGGGGGGGYSGGGAGYSDDDATSEGGGGGGSYADPLLVVTANRAGANGSSQPLAPANGYVTINGSTFAYTGQVVDYTIPASGAYAIVAFGAEGGASSRAAGGFGAEYGGDIALLQGTVLGIVAGGAGGVYSGGGGGSFVWIFSEPKSTPIPEPSTWALLALGFAGLGFAGWRSRRQARFPAICEDRSSLRV
jgi:hypothetical protein